MRALDRVPDLASVLDPQRADLATRVADPVAGLGVARSAADRLQMAANALQGAEQGRW